MIPELHLVHLLRVWAAMEPDACRVTHEEISAHPDWSGALELRVEVAWHPSDEDSDEVTSEWHAFTVYLVELDDGFGIGFDDHPYAEYTLQGLVQHAAHGRAFLWHVGRDADEPSVHVASVGLAGEPRMTARGSMPLEALLHAYLLVLDWLDEFDGEDDEQDDGGALLA